MLRALGHCKTPAWPLNVSGSSVTSIRWLAEEFGERLGKTPKIVGEEAATAWLANTEKAQALFGQPIVPIDKMIDWVTNWVSQGQANLGKPTHFEARDGDY